jgi:hypothetical protein
VYSLSQRRGKKKAVSNEAGDWQSYSGIEPYASDADVAIQPTFDIEARVNAIQPNNVDPNVSKFQVNKRQSLTQTVTSRVPTVQSTSH